MNAFKKFLYATALPVSVGFLFIGVLSVPAVVQSIAAPGDIYTGIFPEDVALVSGEPIKGSQLEVEVRKEMIPIGNPKWTDLREDYRNQLVYNMLNSLINTKLLFDEALANGVNVSDAEVQDEYLKMTQRFKNEEELNTYLEQLSIDTTKAIEGLHENLVIAKFVDQAIRSRVAVTPDEMEAYYRGHQDDFRHPDIVRTSQIMIESDGSEESDARAKKQAQDLLKRIESGEDFAELARKYSVSPSANQGGDIGYSARDALEPEYADLAFSIPIGNTRIIKAEQGYRILKVTDRKKEGIATLEESQEPLREFLIEEKTQAELRKLINSLRDRSEIEYLIPAGPTLTP